ncbi:hypothetical protein HID58_049322 [Brassica napus]|uniref:Uncharacterized protein n=1 Tax=Brassica napus TaxID=3708 RepID=A0ABQ8B4N6_BRANA|nr:hypothetical protein HID58_049322 [Brassica napus]
MASQFSIKLRTLAKGFTKLSKQTCSEAVQQRRREKILRSRKPMELLKKWRDFEHWVEAETLVSLSTMGEGEVKEGGEGEVKEGVASIALLPCGSISGHFIHMPLSICYGLHGTVVEHELACETECSRGEDYRLMKLTIIDYNSKKEQTVVVECKGHDAARINDVEHAHG